MTNGGCKTVLEDIQISGKSAKFYHFGGKT